MAALQQVPADSMIGSDRATDSGTVYKKYLTAENTENAEIVTIIK
jgi:hypothetical protein